MSLIDVSVVLNVHREAELVRTTLISLDRCAEFARERGVKSELVAVFDRSDDNTRVAFGATRVTSFECVHIVETDHGSLGPSRNSGIDVAIGDYIWTADADDLVSENCIYELYKTAVKDSKSVVVVNYYVAFGDSVHVAKYYDSSYLTVADFVYVHPYVSRIFVHRDAFKQTRYSDLPVSVGFAYEDWDLNCRLLAIGYIFLVANETIIFYRQRRDGLLAQANRLSLRMIPHNPAFAPARFMNELSKLKEKSGNFKQLLEKRKLIDRSNYPSEILRSSKLSGYLMDASKIESEIVLEKIASATSYTPVPRFDDHWGYKLADAYRLVGASPFTDVVLISALSRRDQEENIIEVLHEVAAREPNAKFLVVCGESSKEHNLADRLPARSTLIDAYNAFLTMNVQDRDQMIARLLLAVSQAGARLHFKPEGFSARLLRAYGNALFGHYVGVFYSGEQRVTAGLGKNVWVVPVWDDRREVATFVRRAGSHSGI